MIGSMTAPVRLALLGGIAVSGLVATPVFAQQDQTAAPADAGSAGDIVVTARRKSERLQDVPVAVTALSGDTLATRRIDSAESLRFVAPALQVSPSSFGKAVPGYTIRSQRSLESLITQDPAVGIYFAEQVQQRPHGTNAALYDLASVEVLKGPQGTLFGRNTTGGAILINPARPSHDFGGMVQAEGGQYDLARFTGVLNVPLGDTLAARVAGRVTRRSGFVTNLFNGQKTDNERTESARFSLLWEPNDQFSSYTVGNYFHENDAGTGFALAQLRTGSAAAGIPGVSTSFARQSARSDFWTVENNFPPFTQVTSYSVSNTSTIKLDTITIKNIFGYRRVKSLVGFDYDGSNVSVFESQNLLKAHQWTEELQVSGNATERLNYIAGLYYFREHGRDIQNSILFGTRANDGEGKNDSYSAYAQFGYKLATGLNLTAGFRYTIDERAFIARSTLNNTCRVQDDNGVALPITACFRQLKTSFRAPGWLVSLDYKLAPDTMVYLSHRRGYRSGGWNLRGNRLEDQVPFRPETVDDIELGVKAQLFDRKLTINAAAYNQWYRDIQRTLSFGAPLRSLVINAGGATIRGGELELTANPVPWLEFGATAAYSNAYYTNFFRAELGDLKRNFFAMAPEMTYTVSGKVYLPIPEAAGQLDIGASYYHQSSIYVSDLNQGNFVDIPIAPYGVLDLSTNWRNVGGRPIDLGAYVKNVTQTKYYTGGATVYPSTGTAGYILGEPRRWGVSLTYHFGATGSR